MNEHPGALSYPHFRDAERMRAHLRRPRRNSLVPLLARGPQSSEVTTIDSEEKKGRGGGEHDMFIPVSLPLLLEDDLFSSSKLRDSTCMVHDCLTFAMVYVHHLKPGVDD